MFYRYTYIVVLYNDDIGSLLFLIFASKNWVPHCFSSYNSADGPAEDLYGIFINRLRRERPPEVLDRVRGWVITTLLIGMYYNIGRIL